MKASLLVLAALVALSVQQTCKEGACCDLKTNTLRPKGYPCNTNPCTETVSCTGTNPFCPIGNVHKVNGTVCPEGVCFNGKCKQATPCVGDCCDKNNVAKVDGSACPGGQCIDGKCTSLPVCIGSCCDGAKAKADGTQCPEGSCVSGMCINTAKRCAVGHCCDLNKKLLRPKGFPCTNNPCAAKVECTGLSEICPQPTHYKVDGTPCPTGICMNGVCINEPYNATKVAEEKRIEDELKAQQGQKVIVAGNLKIHHHYVSMPVCKEGACCDTEKQEVFQKGHNCTERTCYVGVCDGKTFGCEYTPAPAGTPCEGGSCFDGVCVKDCIGMCCDDDGVSPKEDGSACGDGFCFKGACIKNCKGECCEPLKLYSADRYENARNERLGRIPQKYGTFMQAKADGSACANGDGYCMKGECHRFTVPQFRPEVNKHPEVVPHESDVRLFINSFKERFVKNFFLAAAKVENDQIDEEDLAYLQKKIAKKQDEIAKERKKQYAAAADEDAELLAAANSTESESWYSKIFNRAMLFYFLAGLCALAILACIVKIVMSRNGGKKGEEKKKGDVEEDDYAQGNDNYDF